MNAGAEVTLIKLLSLRAGYRFLNEDGQFSLGAGISSAGLTSLDVRVDYAYVSFGDALGATHRITLIVGLDKRSSSSSSLPYQAGEVRSSRARRRGSYGNWPRRGTQWVQYEWPHAVFTREVQVYWWDDGQGVRLPKACRLLYWDGTAFVPVRATQGLGVLGGQYNVTTFDEVITPKLRLEFDGTDRFSIGILEWKVLDSGKSPEFPPSVTAGVDRAVVLGGKTYLSGVVKGLRPGRSG